MLIEALPHIAYRENLQTAELMAAVLNMMGGKPDPDESDKEKAAKRIDPSRLYSGEELLVWFAKTPRASAWTKEAARVVHEARNELPSWVKESLPWKDINSLLR